MCRRWDMWAQSPASRQLLSLLTAVVEAGGTAESWMPASGAAAAAAAARPCLDSMEAAIGAAVDLLTCLLMLPAGEEWPALQHWLLVGGGIQALINASKVLRSGPFQRSAHWSALCPAMIAVTMYSSERISAADALWQDASLAEGVKRHLSLMLRACIHGGGECDLVSAYTASFLCMALATDVMPSLAQQLHPDLLILWPHLLSSLQLTHQWDMAKGMVCSFMKLLEALPLAVRRAHWLQHCTIAADAICLAFDVLAGSEQPERARRSSGVALQGGVASPTLVLGILRRAGDRMDYSSELPTCVCSHFTLH